MTYDDAFLRSVTDDPDNDAPRLVYADWLEEQGRSQRAEFIRVQCALARLPQPHAWRPELEARERLLLREHEKEWLAALHPGVIRGTFRRGFVDAITLPARVYLDESSSLRRRAPLRRIEVDLSAAVIPGPVIELVPESIARQYSVVPLGLRDATLVLAMRNADDLDIRQLLWFVLNRDLEFIPAPADQIDRTIGRHYDEVQSVSVTTTCTHFVEPEIAYEVDAQDDDAPVAGLVTRIIQEALSLRADQVHIEGQDGRLQIRYRVGGELVERASPPARLLEPILARIRHITAPDPARRAFDEWGRIRGAAGGVPFDFGVGLYRFSGGACVVLTM